MTSHLNNLLNQLPRLLKTTKNITHKHKDSEDLMMDTIELMLQKNIDFPSEEQAFAYFIYVTQLQFNGNRTKWQKRYGREKVKNVPLITKDYDLTNVLIDQEPDLTKEQLLSFLDQEMSCLNFFDGELLSIYLNHNLNGRRVSDTTAINQSSVNSYIRNIKANLKNKIEIKIDQNEK